MSFRRSPLLHGALVLALVAPAALSAQASAGAAAPLATRTLLAQQADSLRVRALAAAKPAARMQLMAEERVVRQRLSDGDFAPGDVVILEVAGEPAVSDTFAVRAGRVVSLPEYGDLSLHGVLRTELTSHVTKFMAKYLKDPQVRTSSLVKVAVLGAVGRPGYHQMPADTPLSDALMRAGGPAPIADFKKIEIRRSDVPLWSPSEARVALGEGLTLDHLGMHSGDEILVGQKTVRWGIMQYISTASAIAGVATLVFTLTRSR